jgi:hypothetical protein
MKLKVYRVPLTEDLYKKYKHLCIEMDLSLPKQTAALIKEFVAIQEENKQRMGK